MYGIVIYQFHMNFTEVTNCDYASFTDNTVILEVSVTHLLHARIFSRLWGYKNNWERVLAILELTGSLTST